MPTCPAGHDSASSDFCDVCGVRISASAAPAVTPASSPPSSSQPVAPAGPCPLCGTPRSGHFCESCGFDFDSGKASNTSAPVRPVAAGDQATTAGGAAPVQSGAAPQTSEGPATSGGASAWTAVVASDHAYYESVVAAGGPDAADLQYPGYCPERRFRLAGTEMRIGRRSTSRGLEPEIDLTGPPTDPGVSRLHAVLVAEPDGSWVVLDPGSENGTLVNGSEIAAGVRVPLNDGDRIHLGAWTVITIHAD
jgi:FHA domain